MMTVVKSVFRFEVLMRQLPTIWKILQPSAFGDPFSTGQTRNASFVCARSWGRNMKKSPERHPWAIPMQSTGPPGPTKMGLLWVNSTIMSGTGNLSGGHIGPASGIRLRRNIYSSLAWWIDCMSATNWKIRSQTSFANSISSKRICCLVIAWRHTRRIDSGVPPRVMGSVIGPNRWNCNCTPVLCPTSKKVPGLLRNEKGRSWSLLLA